MKSLMSAFLILSMGSTAAVMAGPAPAAATARPQASAIEELGHYAEDAYDQVRRHR